MLHKEPAQQSGGCDTLPCNEAHREEEVVLCRHCPVPQSSDTACTDCRGMAITSSIRISAELLGEMFHSES